MNRMNRCSLDSLGIAGFSHDFGTLHHKSNAAMDLFDSFAKNPAKGISIIFTLLMAYFPILRKLPNKRRELTNNLRATMIDISETLLQSARFENDSESLNKEANKSIIGTLSKSLFCFVC